MIESFKVRKIAGALFALEIFAIFFPPYISIPDILRDASYIVFALSSIAMIYIHSKFPRKHDRPEDFEKLYTDGVYRFCRHPFYLSMIICSISLAVSTGSIIAIILSILITLTLFVVIEIEEKELESYWGEAWREDAKRTPKLIPIRIYIELFKRSR